MWRCLGKKLKEMVSITSIIKIPVECHLCQNMFLFAVGRHWKFCILTTLSGHIQKVDSIQPLKSKTIKKINKLIQVLLVLLMLVLSLFLYKGIALTFGLLKGTPQP